MISKSAFRITARISQAKTLSSSWTILRRMGFMNQSRMAVYPRIFSINATLQRNFAKKTKQAMKEEDEAKKERIRQRFQDMDFQSLHQEWDDEFDLCIEDFEDCLKTLKSYRASPNMFDDVSVPAYGDAYNLSELAQTIVRGENNLLISVYDESLKESVMKAIIMSDSELECTIEGKYVSVKMGMTRSENRDKIAEHARKMHLHFKSELSKERSNFLGTLKELEAVLPMDEIDIQRKELDELFHKKENVGKDIYDRKIVDIMRK
ncbi:unnamed protein product [Moneuplotes crassus]|uniref:Ribosome recycling factor domain-containing protein n=2 Tax=Euplotes crassus TaxID=5936 RepID=A0AAD2D2E4_EUPCR|nr:unnamed protein product [Moneuplotes crassus]